MGQCKDESGTVCMGPAGGEGYRWQLSQEQGEGAPVLVTSSGVEEDLPLVV